MKVITIGRASENDVALADMNVSRHHAQIVQADNGTYTITDLNSTNGTFVNGQRITGTIALRESDFVKVGDSILPWKQYFYGSAQSATRQAGQGGFAANNANAQVYVQNVQNVQKEESNYNQQPEPQGSNGFATAGFILAFFIPLLGLIFSAIGIGKANKLNGKGRGLAVWGLVLSIISIVAVVIYIIVIASAASSYSSYYYY